MDNQQAGAQIINSAYQYQTIDVVGVIGALIVMLVGMFLVFSRLKEKGQGFGPNSLKALGVVIFLPLIVLLAILSDFKPETLSVLLGTVAGYVLSGYENNSNTDDKK